MPALISLPLAISCLCASNDCQEQHVQELHFSSWSESLSHGLMDLGGKLCVSVVLRGELDHCIPALLPHASPMTVHIKQAGQLAKWATVTQEGGGQKPSGRLQPRSQHLFCSPVLQTPKYMEGQFGDFQLLPSQKAWPHPSLDFSLQASVRDWTRHC